MITKNELKYFASLTQKKNRIEENKFIVEGFKSVEEGLNSNFECEAILVSFEYEAENKEIVKQLWKKGEVNMIHNNELKLLTDTKTPQGIVAVFKKPETKNTRVKTDNIIVFLDNINDPGNLGTIIRICDWFGINYIFLSENCVEVYNSKTLRASMGSVFHIKFFEDTPFEELSILKKGGYTIAATDLRGKDLFELTPSEKSVLIFSNESNGPSPELINYIDYYVSIPKYGKAESLNVAAASAVVIGQFMAKLKK